jgi:hypothetical protein
MSKRFPSGILLLALFIVCLGGVLGYVVLRRAAPAREINKLMTFAGNLDYRPEAHLAQYRTCWGVFLTECGQFLYYTTGLGLQQFQTKLAQATPASGIPKIVDGYTLLDINQVSNSTLSIDGKIDSLERTGIPEPTAYGWLDTEGGEHWVIRFYETAKDGHVYKIDEKPIIGNIVMVMLRTK